MFMQAGLDLSVFLEVEKRWPAYSEDERQEVVRRVTPNRDKPLEWER
jgi:hypothetical protein